MKGVSQDDLTKVDVPAGDGIEMAELEGGAGEDVAGDHGHGGGVQGDERPVGQHQRPAADKGVLLAEGGVGVDELAAGEGELLDHVAVAEADDGDDHGTQHQAQDSAHGAGFRQEVRPGKNEAAPTDDGAQGQGPDVDFPKVFFELTFRLRLIGHKQTS